MDQIRFPVKVTLIAKIGDRSSVVWLGVLSKVPQSWRFNGIAIKPGSRQYFLRENPPDLGTLLANFGRSGGAAYAEGDVDGVDDVDFSDLINLLARFETVCKQQGREKKTCTPKPPPLTFALEPRE